MSLYVFSQDRVNRKPAIDNIMRTNTLGRNTSWSHELLRDGEVPTGDHGYIVSLKHKRNGVLTLISGHSTGKTVLVKRIIDTQRIVEPRRPGIIFDMQGQDWRAMKYPSQTGLIFPKRGEWRHGHGDRVCTFTPAFLWRDNHYSDYQFTIPWTSLTETEWEYLLVQGSNAKSWIHQFKHLMNFRKHRIRSMRHLHQEVKRTAYEKGYSSDLLPRMRDLEIVAMESALRVIIQKNYLSEPGDARNVNFVELLEQGYIPVLNFHLDKSVPSKLYTGVILRQIYQYYNQRFSRLRAHGYTDPVTGPWIVVEEGNIMMPPKEFGQQVSPPGEDWIEKIISKGMKLGFKLYQIFQDAHAINSDIRRQIQNDTTLLCNPTIDDLKAIASRWGPKHAKVIMELDHLPDDTGAKEWALLEMGLLTTFRPAASMSEFLKR